MTPEFTRVLLEAVALIIIPAATLVGVIFRVIGKRFERREKERAALAKIDREEKEAELNARIEQITADRERDKQMVAQNGELVQAILDMTHNMREQNRIQGKSLETLTDMGRILSAHSSALVGNTESIGELSERTGAVRDGVDDLRKDVKKIESAVNDLKKAIGETGDMTVTERLNQLQTIVSEVKTSLNTKPLQVVPPSEPKTETPAA